jgi:hypothetical protein
MGQLIAEEAHLETNDSSKWTPSLSEDSGSIYVTD